MTARVLVVDDILANVKLLEARLTAEYFDVLTAMSGPEALELCENALPDIVLLDVMMPGMDGFEVCRRLKRNPKTQHLPVIMVTALDQPSDKVAGLEAGADDFLTKPVDDLALTTRVKNLVRLKTLTDELRMRASTGEQMGLNDHAPTGLGGGSGGRILVVDDQQGSAERIGEVLSQNHFVQTEPNPQQSLIVLAESDWDIVMVSLSLNGYDGLRLCSQIRSIERTRNLPIIMITEPGDNARLLRGLEMGVNDYLARPIDRAEMQARVRTQLRRKRYADRLRDSFEQSVEAAVTDALTELHNRRYMESHLKTLVEQSAVRGKALSILITDIDYFKSVNDTYGHDIGDVVLKEFAKRLRSNIRGIDLACRYGGEEFVIVMPDTDVPLAWQIGERLRQCIAGTPFDIGPDRKPLVITASVGVAALEWADDTPETILKRADQALYCAKRDGRNRVVADAA